MTRRAPGRAHNNPYYAKDNRPYLWAWDINTGKVVWKKDFSKYGSGGNDCGLALMDGKLYYSTFFGYQASKRRRRGLPAGINGLTASLNPATGEELWLTTKYYVTAGCTVSAKDGRLYLGGYNRAREGTDNRYIWCLDAKNARTPDEVAAGLRKLWTEPGERERLRREGRAWYDRYHSNAVIARTFTEAIGQCVDG